MAKNRGRPRGPAQGKPTDQAILAALTAAGGNVSKAAIALGHNRRSVSRWAAEIRDGKREPAAAAPEQIAGPDVTDPAGVRAWTITRLIGIAQENTKPALEALDKLAALCGSSSGTGQPQAVDLWARKLLAAALRDFLAGLEGDERAVYIAAAKPRATADEIDALAAIIAGTRWVVRLERA